MGMIKCEYCDSPMSAMAHKCPNCGGVVSTSVKKQSITYVKVEKDEESIFKRIFHTISFILKKIIKYIFITFATMVAIALIAGIVIAIKTVSGNSNPPQNTTTTIESVSN